MKKFLLAFISSIAIMSTQAQNPFFSEYDTPHGTVPFSKITTADYEPAIDRGIELGLQEIEAICNNRAVPDFDNTIVALENSGKDLDRVLNTFGPLLSALSDDEMMELSMRVTPKLSEYSTAIALNTRLWEKIK